MKIITINKIKSSIWLVALFKNMILDIFIIYDLSAKDIKAMSAISK
jgi:hypothetical protein